MRVEIPQLKRCCFCMPLRRGLLTWVYVKLVLALIASLFLLAHAIVFNRRSVSGTLYAATIIGLIQFLLEIIFDILFLVSAHKKNFTYLRIYYRYAVVMLVIQVIAVLMFIAFEIYVIVEHPLVLLMFNYMVEITFFALGQTGLQAYFVILVRSELLKLENNTQFEFVNHTSEPECKAQIIV
ncbi:uncharacterized protein [Epargyreus clarus]|uniref:uncharacterized protein n=1 Tax=Epargyreus clarus TaxID=520877 RepID=UPI003C2D668B